MRGDGMQHSEAATTSTSGLPPVRWHLGKPMHPHDLSYWPDGKGVLNMKALGKALLVLLSVGVAASAAARPRVPPGAWPGVSDVLLNAAVAEPAAAWPTLGSASVLVFPDFRTGSPFFLPASEYTISVVCPQDSDTYCSNHPTVTMEAHWVCPGDTGEPCQETDFQLTATINGTVTFGTEGGLSSSGDQLATPPCFRGYLIVWVIDNALLKNPIKFDGLIGVSVRRGELGDWTYAAVPMHANASSATG